MHFDTILWLLAHKGDILADISAIIATASALVWSLEKLSGLLASRFQWMVGPDGELLHLAGWMDGLSKSSILNAAALTPARAKPAPSVVPGPPPSVKALVVLGMSMGLLLGTPARAQGVLWSAGPTIPLMEIRAHESQLISLAPGAGYQLSATLPALQKAIAGRAWDLLSINLMAFGTDISTQSGASFGALSGALGLCTMSSLVCAGGGHDIITSGTSGWFGLLALNFNIALGPSSPPAGVEKGTAGMIRGNTLYLGAP
jgi:hypothetical protein